MKCQNCEVKLKTISVFDRGHEVFREKRCPVCSNRIITIERLTDANSIPNTIRKPGLAREHITDGTPCWCNPETTYTYKGAAT